MRVNLGSVVESAAAGGNPVRGSSGPGEQRNTLYLVLYQDNGDTMVSMILLCKMNPGRDGTTAHSWPRMLPMGSLYCRYWDRMFVRHKYYC